MRQVVDIIALALARMIIGALSVLPSPLPKLVSRSVILLARIALPRSKRVALRNLELVFPEKSIAERTAIYQSFWKVLARNLETFAKIPKLTVESLQKVCDASEMAVQVEKLRPLSKTGGIVFVTAHFGCFEMGAQVYAVLWRPASFLVREFGLPRLDHWWTARREVFGSKVYGRKGGYRTTIGRLKQGDDIGILCDQNVKKNHATFVNFFGISAATTKTIGHAVVQTGSPAVFTVMAEIEPGQFKMYAWEIYNPEEGGQEDLEAMTKTIMGRAHAALETAVKNHPDHWFWIHRRFKTRPEGEPETIYDF